MKILITGITGTLGRILLSKLISDHFIVGYSRDEQKQRSISKHPNLTLFLGDVRDRDRLLEASKGVDLVFHLAALKCVDTLEEHPFECVRTNVLGTANVVHAQQVHEIPRVVLTSTDKAVSPVNTYGFSKALAERLVLRNPANIVCRYGNVVGSRGSVIPLFAESIERDGCVRITDNRMTRFWMTQEEAADFVISASKNNHGGLNVPHLKAARIVDVAQAVGKVLDEDFEVKEVGIRPGEKLHEQLDNEQYSELAERFTVQELEELVEGVLK